MSITSGGRPWLVALEVEPLQKGLDTPYSSETSSDTDIKSGRKAFTRSRRSKNADSISLAFIL